MRLLLPLILLLATPILAVEAEPATVSSPTQDGAEARAADAVSKAVSPPPAPAKATGELTDGERLFQGTWQLNEYGPDTRWGTMRIDDRDFRAEGVAGRYAGYVSIRSDTSPARLDFTIEDCECKFIGMTSTGIYYEDDGTIVFASPAPGDPRPEAFKPNEMWRMHPLDPATEGDGEKPR